MNRFDAVLFDLDGTLLYTLPDIHGAVNAALTECGYPGQTLEMTRGYVGDGSRKLIERSLPAGTDPGEVTRVLAAYRACYNKNLIVDTAPYPGMPETLNALRNRGVAMACVTNKFHESAVHIIRRFFPECIPIVEGNIDGRPTKPAPDAALAAMAALGVTRERTLFVGDSGVDADTAKNTGLECVLCDWGYWDRSRLEGYDVLGIIRRPEQLIDYI